MRKKNPIIAIDGPAASGKGTLARKIADALSFAHMDTGALYRAVGYMTLENGDDPADIKAAIKNAQSLCENFEPDFLDNPILRSDENGQAASKVAAVPEVRTLLLDLQRGFADDPGAAYKGAVLDGRDIGTVICPDADVKLFITADVGVRAERRLKELQSKGIPVTKRAVLEEMRARDARDEGRKAAPSKPAGDAVTLDTSRLSISEVLKQALDIIQSKLPGPT